MYIFFFSKTIDKNKINLNFQNINANMCCAPSESLISPDQILLALTTCQHPHCVSSSEFLLPSRYSLPSLPVANALNRPPQKAPGPF